MLTVLGGKVGRKSSAKLNSVDPITCTPDDMVSAYGVPMLAAYSRIFPDGFIKPSGLALEVRYFKRQVLAPKERAFQGRFARAGDLFPPPMNFTKEEVDGLIRGRKRKMKRIVKDTADQLRLPGTPDALVDLPAKVRYQHLDRILERALQPLSLNHPAVRDGRSLYPEQVFEVTAETELLVSGLSNSKVGRYVVHGDRRLWGELFTVGWEERVTCSKTCHHWRDCYTNNSPFMKRKRYDLAREDEILGFLQQDVEDKLRRVKTPYVYVRLHQSGDFPTVRYAEWWGEALELYPRLMVYGYSHWPQDTEIGKVLQRLNERYWQTRFRIYTSNGGGRRHCANTFTSADAAKKAGNMPCPEQVGRSPSCGECQMCLPGPKSRGGMHEGSIGFIVHQLPTQPGQKSFDFEKR